MPKRVKGLTDLDIRKAKPKEKEYMLTDGDGLYLVVTPSGGKLWRLKYTFEGNRGKLTLGKYPDVSLLDARERRLDVHKKIAQGINPAAAKKAQKITSDVAEGTFRAVALEWLEVQKHSCGDSHVNSLTKRLENDVFPWLKNRPLKEIEPPEILEVLRRIENRGAVASARKLMYTIGQIFRYGVATKRAERDQTADLRGALKTPLVKHMAALTDPTDVAELLRLSREYKGTFVVQSALNLAPLVFCRPGELRHTEWSEVDFENAEINVPLARLKSKKTEKIKNAGKLFAIPLSKQALKILRELHPLTKHSKYVFPGLHSASRPMSKEAVRRAIRKLGFDSDEHTGHGFRATARTMIRERLHIDAEYIEIQLNHKTKAPNGRAYDRVTFLPERHDMMQKWADYLDQIRETC